MRVHHKNPTFTGSVVAATTRFEFKSGVAEVEDLSASKLAILAARGWHVADDDSADTAASAMTELANPKAKAKRDFEIGEKVAPEHMEKPEPEIG
ncbi:hypothetical protein [Williamsia sp. DF01-3]|uniref:hypothetical protein n=1 Tax=Williamsia sp. DF01-3 TaxID=2934157 RepID=UPI001FF22054|nr:hypothetical protein [Williamsia sp. DF01-3]MCK0517871.1 hypothetical protein [Williamsia sp. DF01-3]